MKARKPEETERGLTSDQLELFWYEQLSRGCLFDADTTRHYAGVLTTNEVTPLQIRLLNHDMLKSMGIEKAGHRAKVPLLYFCYFKVSIFSYFK